MKNLASTLKPILKSALLDNGILLSEEIQEKLLRYLELMQTWNRVFNLTTITQPQEMVYLHIIDSLSILPYLHGKRCLDVGTGAGLPGIPLALANPEIEWVLLDKNNKKTRFLTQTIAELGLQAQVQAAHSRGEDFHPPSCFDSIISRAFGTIQLFAETTGHLLCPSGKLIAMKGRYPQDEMHDLPHPFVVENVIRLEIKGLNVERHIIQLIKEE
jgi:16S rRNA (guanine527-N7)-methyltransferase